MQELLSFLLSNNEIAYMYANNGGKAVIPPFLYKYDDDNVVQCTKAVIDHVTNESQCMKAYTAVDEAGKTVRNLFTEIWSTKLASDDSDSDINGNIVDLNQQARQIAPLCVFAPNSSNDEDALGTNMTRYTNHLVSSGEGDVRRAHNSIKYRRRYCRSTGCTRVVKSQGMCQRHGATPRLCKIMGCGKQAQGSFEGMCKSHFKSQFDLKPDAVVRSTSKVSSETSSICEDDVMKSVYDSIIPSSIEWESSSSEKMPLAMYLENGYRSQRPYGWHRNGERAARVIEPVTDYLGTTMESWEERLIWDEALLLNGHVSGAASVHLAHAWGQLKGFHKKILSSNCQQLNFEKGDGSSPRRGKYEESLEASYFAFMSDPFDDA